LLLQMLCKVEMLKYIDIFFCTRKCCAPTFASHICL
jgi:hypothetical protein